MKNLSILLALTLMGLIVLPGASFEATPTTDDTTATPQAAAAYVVDKAHSQIGFKVRHLGITNVNGLFKDYEANVSMDGDDLSTLQASATIQIGSISTGIDRRDGHLKSDDFFNAETYPEMKFVSKAVRNIDGSEFELVGDLTIRDITKEVVLEAEFLGMGAMGDTKKAGFEAETTIDRFDYNLKWDRLTEAGGLVVSDKVKIMLDLELNEADS
ncbi:MAG: YceI family protein [Bacteroidota bacterium]